MLAAHDWEMSPALPRLTRALLTAIDDQDLPLLKPRLLPVFEALLDLTNNVEWLRSANSLPVIWQQVSDFIKANPREDYDELGKQLETLFDKGLASLADLRENLVKILAEAGYEATIGPELQARIEALQGLKQSVLEDWPWSDRELPPVGRHMVAQSRAMLTPRESFLPYVDPRFADTPLFGP